MKLLGEIIESVTAQAEPISQTLRRCLVLAYKLKNDRLKAWVEAELNGYPDQEDLPDYRHAHGTAKGLFLGAFQSELRNQPLPAMVMKEEHRHWATDIRLAQPIAAYDSSKGTATKTAMLQWPQDLVVLYQKSFYQGYALNRAWMEIPGSMIAGLVDTVRTRVLTFALEIQSELPEDTDQAVEQIPAATVERIVQVTIYGGNVNIGDNGLISANTVIAGDTASLKAALEGLGLAEKHAAELQKAIAEDGKTDGLGKKALAWIGKTAKAGAKAGLKVGGDVATAALTAYAMQYLGLPPS